MSRTFIAQIGSFYPMIYEKPFIHSGNPLNGVRHLWDAWEWIKQMSWSEAIVMILFPPVATDYAHSCLFSHETLLDLITKVVNFTVVLWVTPVSWLLHCLKHKFNKFWTWTDQHTLKHHWWISLNILVLLGGDDMILMLKEVGGCHAQGTKPYLSRFNGRDRPREFSKLVESLSENIFSFLKSLQ